MLEYLFFRIGGYFEGNRVLFIRDHDGCLSLDCCLFSHRQKGDTVPHYHDCWTKARSKRCLDKLAAIHIETWDDKYWDYEILDGTQWELRYKLEGQAERRISGSNAYPKNWEYFIRWITNAVHRLPTKENIDVDKTVNTVIKLASVIKR